MSKTILVIGLNPAWQKTLMFQELKKGEVNRAVKMVSRSSGKGANFAIRTEKYGNKAILAQFIGGNIGKLYNANLAKDNDLELLNQEVIAETRTCTTLLCEKSGETTEIIEPSGEISQEESNLLLKKVLSKLETCDGVALCGTYPPGISESFYIEIAKFAKKKGKPIILDSFKNIKNLLNIGVDILKINKEELFALTLINNVEKASKTIAEKYCVKIVAITDGPNEASLYSNGNFTKYKVPYVENVINPIGAGDVVSAVFFNEYLAGKKIVESFKNALAEGSKHCAEI